MGTTRVKYVGHLDEIVIPDHDDGRHTFKRGEPIDVDAALATRLLEQKNAWKPVGVPPAMRPKAAPKAPSSRGSAPEAPSAAPAGQ